MGTVFLVWCVSIALLNEATCFPSHQSALRNKRSGTTGHEEFWANQKFMDHLGEYLTSNEESKVHASIPKASESSKNTPKPVPAAVPQHSKPSISRSSRSNQNRNTKVEETSWQNYQYPSETQQRSNVAPAPSTYSQQPQRSQETSSPVVFKPQAYNSRSDQEGSESILIPSLAMYTAYKAYMGLTTPSPTKSFSNLIIATPYPTQEAVTATAPSTPVVEQIYYEQPTQQIPSPVVPIPQTFSRSESSSNKEHRVLVFHLPPDAPIPSSLLQASSNIQNSTGQQQVYFQKPQPSPPATSTTTPTQVPLSYIVGESNSQFYQPQQSLEVPLNSFSTAHRQYQKQPGPIVSNVPYPLPSYSNIPFKSSSINLSSLPSFGSFNVQSFAASDPQPQRQPYIPQIPLQPTPFPIAIPHSQQQQTAQFSNPASSILIATPAPVVLPSPTSGYLTEENEVDKKPAGQENVMGNIADWIETGRKIMYFPKGVVDVVDKAVSYAEHNPYVGLVMDTVADKIFGSTKPLSQFQEKFQLALAQQANAFEQQQQQAQSQSQA